MGLDVVELLMRTEEVFGISIDDFDAGQIRTVGDLYEAVCTQLNVSPSPNPDMSTFALISTSKNGPLSVHTPDEIWVKLIAIIADQLQINPEGIRYNSRFG